MPTATSRGCAPADAARHRPSIGRGLLFGIGGLTLLNAIVAVFWLTYRPDDV
ncbi:hypothetical protein [Kribbella sp. CA-247076]|uniref:hypothetical protein n=1 Tax=Kribbella sp. CA-247076 TaxID=3239941 RepID=UPI003D8D82DA